MIDLCATDDEDEYRAGNDDEEDDDNVPTMAAYKSPGKTATKSKRAISNNTDNAARNSRKNAPARSNSTSTSSRRSASIAASNPPAASTSSKPPESAAAFAAAVKRQRLAAQDDDDLFTRKSTIVFKSRGKVLKTTSANSTSQDVKPSYDGVNGKGKREASVQSPYKTQPPKRIVKMEINLDSDGDDVDSSASGSGSDSDEQDEDDTKKNGKGDKGKGKGKGKQKEKEGSTKPTSPDKKRKRTGKANGKVASPSKLIIPLKKQSSEDESSSSSSSLTFDSGASDASSDTKLLRQKRHKAKKEREKRRLAEQEAKGNDKGKGKQRENARNDGDSSDEIQIISSTATPAKRRRRKEKSLTPVEKPDAYLLAHALQDVRRNAPLLRQPPPRQNGTVYDTDDNGDISIDVHAPPLPRHRSSASITPAPVTRLLVAQPLTDEQLREKYGESVQITVVMIPDPRQGMTAEMNPVGLARYQSPVKLAVRERQTFANLFEAVATAKDITTDRLVLVYDNLTVFQYGTPASLHIRTTSASFKGYERAAYDYIQTLRESDRKRFIESSAPPEPAYARRNEGPSAAHTVIELDDTSGTDGDNETLEVLGIPNSIRAQVQTDTAGSREHSTHPLQPPDGDAVTSAGPFSERKEDTATAATPHHPAVEAAVSPEKSIRLVLRGKGGKEVTYGVTVKESKTALSLIKHFLKKDGQPASLAPNCVLIFDGEVIEHDMTVQGAALEDEDTVDIKIKGHN